MERFMESEGLWHIVENIFGNLDHDTLVNCRKVSSLWNESLEPLERSFLAKILLKYGVKIAEECLRNHKSEKEEKLSTRKSEWNKAVQKYKSEASIEDLRELKDSVKKLLPLNGIFLYRPQRVAFRLSDSKVLKFLFSTSYNVNDRDWKGGTACLRRIEMATEMAKLFLLDFPKENGMIDLDARDNEGSTAFHRAFEGEAAEVILDFTKGSIDLNATDRQGMTAFHVACKSSNSHCVRWFLHYSKESDTIDLNARDNNGMTGLHLACNGNIKSILDFSRENNDIDLNARDNRRRTPFFIACSLGKNGAVILMLKFSQEKNRIDLNARDNIGRTPFFTALSLGQNEAVRLMLDFSKENHTIDLNARDNKYMTGLHLACERGKVNSLKLILDFSKENGGIDLNARDENGQTAFWKACASGKKRIIKLLLDNWKELDIDIKSKNNEGQTALDVLNIHENEGFFNQNEVKTLLEEEYSKVDSSEPAFKRHKKD